MAKEAEAHSAEDKQKRDEIEARNQLDSLVYNIEKMLKENADKVSGTEKTEVETALADAKKVLEGQPNPVELNAAREKLTAASHKLAEAMYKAGAAGGAGAAGAGVPPTDGASAAAGNNGDQKKDEGVIDAEYVDVEDKK
jgi:molecular chaperone DnaK